MIDPTETEHTAWVWLMALPRMPIPGDNQPLKVRRHYWREMSDRQIKIQVCPGKLATNSGAPLVRISALIPGLKKRVSGQGNSLYDACDRMHNNAWREGLQLPFLSVLHMQRRESLIPQ